MKAILTASACRMPTPSHPRVRQASTSFIHHCGADWIDLQVKMATVLRNQRVNHRIVKKVMDMIDEKGGDLPQIASELPYRSVVVAPYPSVMNVLRHGEITVPSLCTLMYPVTGRRRPIGAPR